MRVRQLNQFLSVCRNDSMSAAAKELNISQPALSKQISQLEHELEADLFVRHSRGITLTQAGKRLRKEAAELIRRFESTKASIKQDKQSVSGVVTIAVISSLAPAIASVLYPWIEQEFQNISLRIVDESSDDAGKILLQQKVDLAIIPNTAADIPEAASTPLFQESFQLVGRGSHTGKQQAITFLEAIQKPLVLPFHGYDLRRRIEEVARSMGAQLNVKYETGSINVINRLIEDGQASTIIPTTFLLDKIASGRLVAQPIISPAITRVHSLCWLPDKSMSPATKVILETIPAQLKAMVAGGKISGNII